MLQISNKEQRKREAKRCSFGNYLRSIRISTSLSSKDLAELAGFSRPTISQYETAKIIPSIKNLDKICAALRDISVEPYKIDILRRKHEDSLNASSGKVVGSVLRD